MNTIPTHLILISKINILNPRSRNKIIFEAIISNIGTLGLKKPIIVSKRDEPVGEKEYDLVCGQGRLEAYIALGHDEIPCIIVATPQEERYIMSLIENIARRHHTPIELLKEVTNLKQRGYTAEQISAKLALERTYINAIIHLLEHGEEALLKEVDRGRIPVTIAVKISTAADQELQGALREAYTAGDIKGPQLRAVKRFLAQRSGKSQSKSTKRLSAQSVVRAYKDFTTQHQTVAKRAERTEQQLLVIVSAMKRLLSDDHFVTLLRAESLDTMPEFLADRIRKG